MITKGIDIRAETTIETKIIINTNKIVAPNASQKFLWVSEKVLLMASNAFFSSATTIAAPGKSTVPS